jgi:hypothetical protein
LPGALALARLWLIVSDILVFTSSPPAGFEKVADGKRY